MAERPAPDSPQSCRSPSDKDRSSLAFPSFKTGLRCNPARPAPMSGGAAVKAAGGVRGITRSARNEVEEDRGYAPPAPSKGLGLDGPGAAGPPLQENAGNAR